MALYLDKPWQPLDAETASRLQAQLGVYQIGDAAGQAVGAAMAAQERHHRAAVLGERHDRRLGALVRDDRRQGAHQHPGGADAEDRPAGLEQRTQVRRGFLEAGVRARGAAGQAVHLGAGQFGCQAARQAEAAPGQHHENRGPSCVQGRIGAHVQASPRLCTRIMEK